MTGILLGQGDKITPGSALRNQDPAIGKGLLDQLAIREIEWKQKLSRFLLHAHVASGEKYRKDVGVVSAVDIRQESLLSGEQFTPSAAQQGDTGVVAVARVTDHIAVTALH